MLIQYPYKHTTWISRWNDVEIHCFNVESMWCVCRDMFDNVSKLYLGIEKDFFKGTRMWKTHNLRLFLVDLVFVECLVRFFFFLCFKKGEPVSWKQFEFGIWISWMTESTFERHSDRSEIFYKYKEYKFSGSLVHQKNFSFIWQVVFKWGYVFC